MGTFFITMIIAFIIVLLAVAALGIGWLLTGKPKLKAGACGRDPNKKQDEDCGSSVNCQLCEKPKNKDKCP